MAPLFRYDTLLTKQALKCAFCRNGNTEEGFATVLLERDETTLVFTYRKKNPGGVVA